MLSLICKKLSKRNKHNGVISPSSSRMLRTISIHHLECNDYVPQSEVGQMAADIEHSNAVLSTDRLTICKDELLVLKETQGSGNGKPGEGSRGIDAADDLPRSQCKLDKNLNHLLYDHIALKGKLLESRDALLKYKDTTPMGMANEFFMQSKLFLDTLVLFNANRKAILDNPEDPTYISPDYVEILPSPAESRMFTKFASCSEFFVSSAGILFQSHKKESGSFIFHGTKSESTSSFINTAGASSVSEDLQGAHELRKRREARSVVNQMSNLKQRIKDVILENRMEKHRISRDGILHRVPFGHNLLEVRKAKKLNLGDEPASEKCEGGVGSKLNNIPHVFYRKFEQKSLQRSRSLTESLDRYSQLSETLSLNAKHQVPGRSKSIQQESGLPLPKKFGRILSTPVLRSCSLVQSAMYFESSTILSPEPIGCGGEKIVMSKSIQEDSALQQKELPRSFGRMLSSPVFRSYSFSKIPQSAGDLELGKILASGHLESEIENTIDKLPTDAVVPPFLKKNDCENEVVEKPYISFSVEEAIRSDKFVIPPTESITEMIGSQVIPVSVDGFKHHEVSDVSLITELMEEQADLVSRLETRTKAESDVRPIKPSFISSIDVILLEDAASSTKDLLPKDLQSTHEQHQLYGAQTNVDCNEHNFAEHSKVGYSDEQMARDACSLIIHVDHKDDGVFEFVRRALSKYGYGMRHLESEVSFHELGAELCNATFEQLLLFDLINEVLLEIYEDFTVPNPWLLHFHSKIRSTPKGSYLLKVVWAEISWHLDPPWGSDATLDDLMAHAFAKTDGWMNIYRDAEFVALQLEHLIFDDLLNEAVSDCGWFDF